MARAGGESLWCSVANLEEALLFYRDYTGMSLLGLETWPGEVVSPLFHLPAGSTARIAILDGGLNRSTKLRLVEFEPGSGRRIRGNAQTRDAGFYCLAYLVKDLGKMYAELAAKGYSFVAPPYHYALSWAPFEVTEVTLKGPDGVGLNHFQRHKPVETFEVPGNYVRMDHCAMMVESLAEARRFGEAVGWDCLAQEMEVPGGLVNEILGLSPDCRVKIADWGIRGGTSAGIEFIEVTPRGRPAVGRPPDTGLFMLTITVDALVPTLSMVKSAGFPLFSGPLRARAKSSVESAIVEGPAGVLMMMQEL
jgi:catechol 2,3-dioxygenase-like lactoylglutathione lyase family enzyme